MSKVKLPRFKNTLESISKTLENLSLNTSYQPTNYESLSELKPEDTEEISVGKSGAHIYMFPIKGLNEEAILKFYDNNYIKQHGHRIVREIYAYLKIQICFHDNNDIDKSHIDFAKLLSHGRLGDDGYYILMTKIDGISLYNSVLSYEAKTNKKIKNNFMWYKTQNVVDAITYILKAYKTLCDIFDGTFIHYDFHPDNIFITSNSKSYPNIEDADKINVEKISIIDFDLIDSDYSTSEIKLRLPKDNNTEQNLAMLAGLTSKIRYFLCYCFEFKENTIFSKMVCGFSQPVIDYTLKILPDIEYLDIRYIYIISVSLINLNKILVENLNKYITNQDRTIPIPGIGNLTSIMIQNIGKLNIAIQEDYNKYTPINLNQMYDENFVDLKKRIPTMDFKSNFMPDSSISAASSAISTLLGKISGTGGKKNRTRKNKLKKGAKKNKSKKNKSKRK